MELRQIGKDSADKALLESINEEAIPENERISLDDMIDTGAEVFGIYRDREPAGYFIIRSYRNVIYLAFLAVRKDLRSGGLGGEAVRAFPGEGPLFLDGGMRVAVEPSTRGNGLREASVDQDAVALFRLGRVDGITPCADAR